jgi:hypothetical protein
MYQLTSNNHLKWYLLDTITDEKRYFSNRQLDTDLFGLELGKPTIIDSNWYHEFLVAVSQIVDNFGTTLNVFYSGGFDSEILVRTLVSLGVKPIIHTIKFSSQENADETSNADSVCKELNLYQNIWKHDVQEYVLSEEYLDLGLKYKCSQMAYLTVLKYVQKCNDYPCLLGGEIYCQKHAVAAFEAAPSNYNWYYIYRENEDAVTYRYTLDTNHPVINEVFSYTPNLIKAWFEIPTVKKVVTNEIAGKLSLLSSKKQIFEECYPFRLTACNKLHGYEKLLALNQIVTNRLLHLILKPAVAKIPVCNFLN